uniref:aminotransferase class III-fold pyridoxal phosphate-dependent enzyme n=1 Tax=uncultured Georgenia sp. TaxID=378209 RepID=UPI00263208BE
LTLVRPELDIWEPGEHNGTFRGFNPAFVTATEAIRRYWSDDELERSTITRGLAIESRFNALVARYQEHGLVAKGRGLARGLQFASGEVAGRVAREAFDNGLLVETSGPQDEVVKLLPPLTITPTELETGMRILERAVVTVLES